MKIERCAVEYIYRGGLARICIIEVAGKRSERESDRATSESLTLYIFPLIGPLFVGEQREGVFECERRASKTPRIAACQRAGVGE